MSYVKLKQEARRKKEERVSAQKTAHSLIDEKTQLAVGRRYSDKITDQIKDTIQGSNISDPVARQYLPDMRELKILPEERADPIGDQAHSPVEGIVHRYPDRVLLKAASVCAAYCRYCFRREMLGPDKEVLS